MVDIPGSQVGGGHACKGGNQPHSVEPPIKDPLRKEQPLLHNIPIVATPIVIINFETSENFSTMDTMVGPKVSFTRRFLCRPFPHCFPSLSLPEIVTSTVPGRCSC